MSGVTCQGKESRARLGTLPSLRLVHLRVLTELAQPRLPLCRRQRGPPHLPRLANLLLLRSLGIIRGGGEGGGRRRLAWGCLRFGHCVGVSIVAYSSLGGSEYVPWPRPLEACAWVEVSLALLLHALAVLVQAVAGHLLRLAAHLTLCARGKTPAHTLYVTLFRSTSSSPQS